MIINHNIPALVTNNALGKANSKTDKSSKRLSTGLRINSAADDAAGLAISNKMKTQVKGLKMADRNCNDAISLIQTAEGGLSEVQNMLQRMRELAVQGANDTLTTSDRQKIQDECDQLIQEINDTASKIQFNTKPLLDGSYEYFTFQVGPNAGLTMNVKMEEITAFKIGAITDEEGTFTSLSMLSSKSSQAIKIGIETNVASGVDASGDSTKVRFALLDDVDNPTAVNVTTYEKGDSTVPSNSGIEQTGTYMLKGGVLYDSHGKDVTALYPDFDPTNSAYATYPCLITVTSSTNKAGATIYKESVTSLTTPSPADPMDKSYTLSALSTDPIQYTMNADNSKLIITDTTSKGVYTTIEGCAYTALLVCDGAIDAVSEFRSRLGAIQNRLEYTSSANGVASENAETALSRVQDTDMAAEMTEYTKNNVITQAGISMLAQANQRPNQLLSLLQ
jgi:flagellin